VIAASCFAVLAPVTVLLVDRGGDTVTGCSARYSSTHAQLTVTLAQPGTLEIRDDTNDTRQHEPSGTSTLTLPSPNAAPTVGSVTEFTEDGQLIVCTLAPTG